jgi:hypothetical protein
MHVIGCGKGIESPSRPCACLPIMTKTQSSPSDFTQEHHPFDLRLTTNLSLCRYSIRFTITHTHTHSRRHVTTSRHIVHVDDHVPIRRWRCPSSSMQPMSATCFPHITACSLLLIATNSADRYCLPPLHTGPHAFAAQRWCTRDFYCRPSTAPIYLVTPVKVVPYSRPTHQHSRARSTKVFACKYVISSNHICYYKASEKEQVASS